MIHIFQCSCLTSLLQQFKNCREVPSTPHVFKLAVLTEYYSLILLFPKELMGFSYDHIVMALLIMSLKYRSYLTLQCVTCSLRFSLLYTACIHCCHPREDVVIDTYQRVMITRFQTVHIIFINSLMLWIVCSSFCNWFYVHVSTLYCVYTFVICF